MYGLVNRAIEEMVQESYGNEVWKRICASAGMDTPTFISNEPYPDEVTYRLVTAASEQLGLPADDVLRAFGEYWVLETGLKAYGPLMRAGGRTLKEFLVYLPKFHVHIQVMFPELRPPEFECLNITEDSLDLHYRSPRPPGLEPFVEGLIMGLAKMFNTEVGIEPIALRASQADASVFRISWA